MGPDELLRRAKALVPQRHGGVDDVFPVSTHHYKPGNTKGQRTHTSCILYIFQYQITFWSLNKRVQPGTMLSPKVINLHVLVNPTITEKCKHGVTVNSGPPDHPGGGQGGI